MPLRSNQQRSIKVVRRLVRSIEKRTKPLFFRSRVMFWPKWRTFHNQERNEKFDFRLPKSVETPGVTALLRVKNEETKIASCLKSIYPLFAQIVVVNNNSTDRTAEIVSEFKQSFDAQGKVTCYDYPFDIARCGKEHASVQSNSLHSLVYYYNYCLSLVQTRHVCKWDADMVAIGAGVQLRDLLRSVVDKGLHSAIFAGVTVYKQSEKEWYLSESEVNAEPRVALTSYLQCFEKSELWEVWQVVNSIDLSESPVFYELKYLDESEFDHWDEESIPTLQGRKRREYDVFYALKRGSIPNGCRRMSAGNLFD